MQPARSRIPAQPASSARALLAGFAALGLDPADLRRAAGLEAVDLEPVDAVVAGDAMARLWGEALRLAPREELPTEVGLAIPFGAFGALDYLAASSETVEAACCSLAAHFRQVASGASLEVQSDDEAGEVRVVIPDATEVSTISAEFTVAVLVGRFRAAATSIPFAPSEVRLTRPAPGRRGRHQALLGCAVRFGCAAASLRVPAASWRARLGSADPALQATLRALAARLELGAASSDLEAAVRARLRVSLPEGGADAAAVSRALGISERTLHRRLREQGTSFRAVLAAFREAEAERLLADHRLPLGEVALRLGFSDQTAWNRAFRRWKGTSPRAWAEARQPRR
jgi:AraC-like DNA-binding protein